MNLFDANRSSLPRWASFENPDAAPGKGGQINRGAKGKPAGSVPAGSDVTLMHADGSGIVRRIWMSFSNRTPLIMRQLVLCMYWDGSDKPAVECPLADFFGFGLAEMRTFESELFSSPEGRSFNCFIPMPFYTGAKIVFSNRSDKDIGLFYDVDFTLEPLAPGEALYFHAFWNRENPVELCRAYTVLPRVTGHGRYLGTSFGVLANTTVYKNTWFGEGEIKFYLDGDEEWPTMVGTGTEDYIGDAWGQNVFANRTQGCLISDTENGRFSFYRWHTVDPIYFQREIRATIHDIGNDMRDPVWELQKSGAPMVMTTDNGRPCFDPDNPFVITEDTPADHSFNFYRQDDYCSVAYFYLDRPASELPRLPDTSVLTAGMQ